MSFVKSDGAKIEIRFSEAINTMAVIGQKYRTLSDAVITSLNNYGLSNLPSLLNDGIANTSSYWRGTTAINWIQATFTSPKIAHGFRWFVGSTSYRPLTFKISGSLDLLTWAQLGETFTGANETGWQEFSFSNIDTYLAYRIDILTASSSRIYLSELELLLDYGNEEALTVTVPEYDFVPNGTIQQNVKPVKMVENKADDVDSIILYVADNQRFNSAAGNTSVAYDATKGNLAGVGGPVESFEVSFTPTDLIAKPHQNPAEHIEISDISAFGALTRICYADTSEAEHISISNIAAVGTLTHINDI